MTEQEPHTPTGSSPATGSRADGADRTPTPNSPPLPLRDARGREITYVRVSLTDRCNFRCVYCMPAEGIPKLEHREMLSLEELAGVVRLLVTEMGLRKVRVTGGEPLVRRGAIEFLGQIGAIPGVEDLALTTNGYLLEELAAPIRAAGVHRLNISLDTLDPRLFREITGVDGLPQVLRGIEAARRAGFDPIKINSVILDRTLAGAVDLVRFGIERGLQVRFIELMAGTVGAPAAFVPAARLRERLAEAFTLTPLAETTPNGGCNPLGDRHASAQLYRVNATEGICGLITPVSGPFCQACNRIRLRGDGLLVPCLSEEARFDLKPLLRPELRRTALIEYIREVVGHSKAHPPARRHIRDMSRIGG